MKTPKDSLAIFTNIVLPNETNGFSNMFGGDLLAKIDKLSAISAQKHSERQVVTVAVNSVSFDKPIPLGSVILIEAKVSRAFGKSMEVFVDVWIDDPIKKIKTKTNEAIYSFVAVDENMKPVPVPPITPETEEEKERYSDAMKRRELSLVLSGKMKASEATELLKAIED